MVSCLRVYHAGKESCLFGAKGRYGFAFGNDPADHGELTMNRPYRRSARAALILFAFESNFCIIINLKRAVAGDERYRKVRDGLNYGKDVPVPDL